jgi:hypothetical protein
MQGTMLKAANILNMRNFPANVVMTDSTRRQGTYIHIQQE